MGPWVLLNQQDGRKDVSGLYFIATEKESRGLEARVTSTWKDREKAPPSHVEWAQICFVWERNKDNSELGAIFDGLAKNCKKDRASRDEVKLVVEVVVRTYKKGRIRERPDRSRQRLYLFILGGFFRGIAADFLLARR